jgi:hypothetical protein
VIKKIFIISTIVFVLAGLAFFAYKYLTKDNSKEQAVETSNETQTKNEETKKEVEETKKEQKQKKIKKIAEGEIKGATFNKKEERIYYFNSNNFLTTDLDGNSKKTIGAHPLGDVQFVSWSKEFDKVLLKSEDNFFVYDFENKESVELKKGTDVAIWNTLRDQLIYKYFDNQTKKRSLAISDVSGENWKEIRDISYQKVDLSMKPKSETVGVYPMPDAFVPGELTLVDLVGENQSKIFEGRSGADYLWSPDGKKVLVSHTLEGDKSKLTLGVMNSNGGEYQGLNFPTSVKKCVWSKDSVNVFCASMNGLPDHAVLPNDWDVRKFDSVADTFWKVNVENAKKNRIVNTEEIEELFDSTDLFLDKDEKYLFFTNRKNGDLYRIKMEIEGLEPV